MKASALVVRLYEKYLFRKPEAEDLKARILMSKERSFSAITGSALGRRPRGGFFSAIKLFENRGNAMRKGMIGAAVAVCAIVVVAGAGFFLTHNKAKTAGAEGSVVFVIGEATLVKSSGAALPVKPQEKIVSGDTVRTGKGSIVTVQLADQGNIKINENSTLVFSSILQNKGTSLVVSQGSVYSKLKKMEKGSSYEVKTPVYVAAVRGTEFLASYGEGKGDIRVADGKVAMAPIVDGHVQAAAPETESVVSGKEGASVENGKIDVRRYELDAKQILELQKDSLYVAAVDQMAGKTADDINAIRESIQKQEKELDVKIAIEDNKSPIQKLRDAGKPLTMVYLRDGSQIQGSMISTDESTMNLDTGEGVIKLPVKEIIRRVPIK